MLKQIGEAIGKALRINAQTTMETRGKYARLCIQVYINKPLINIVLIGRFEQPVVYEGIQKLCFACSRIGHKRDDYPHIVRSFTSLVKGGNDEHGDGDSASSCMMHGTDGTASGSGMAEGSGAATDNDSYGPWMIVSRKKAGQCATKNYVALEGPTGSRRMMLNQANGQGSFTRSTTMGWAKETTKLNIAVPKPSKKSNQLELLRVGTFLDGI